MLKLKKGKKIQKIFSGLLINFPSFFPSLYRLNFWDVTKYCLKLMG